VAILFALATAICYGASDFAAGLGSRRLSSGLVTFVVQSFGLLTACVAVLLFPGVGPTAHALGWGAVSGLGTALGTLTLYRGLAVGRMSVVATLSAVVSAILPVSAGIALGDRLSLLAAFGVVLAIPAIGIVSWQESPKEGEQGRAGMVEGLLAGVGFSIIFIALAQAGTRSGAWPLVPGQAVALCVIFPFARGISSQRKPLVAALPLIVGAGLLSGAANLLFLASTAHGQLAIVAVLAALYPAVTVLLARTVLGERWSRLQAAGLVAAAAAIVLVGFG
jgi:uncharacterized membrane protein